MASLAAWCDSDRDVLARACADVLVDTHRAGGRSWCRTSDRCDRCGVTAFPPKHRQLVGRGFNARPGHQECW